MFGSPAFPLPRDKSIHTLTDKIARSDSNGSPGVGFAEAMIGFIHVGDDIDDFDKATQLARSRGESARFFLSMKSWDISERECHESHEESPF